MGLDSEGSCTFDVAFDWYHLHNPETSAYAAEYRYPIMFKATFKNRLVAKRINVYFAPGFFEQVFTRILDSDNTRSAVCGVYESCESRLTETGVDCATEIARIPVSEGPQRWIDGDSQGCRALHGAFAIRNPDAHCAHISFDAQLDPKMRILCQGSAFVEPDALFDEDDFAFWNDYCARHGFDPERGFNEIV